MRVFGKIKAYAKMVDTNTKLYKEYQRKFRFFLQYVISSTLGGIRHFNRRK